MSGPAELILGEYRRTLDQRFRLAIPGQLVEQLAATESQCVLAKERPGCLSLWNAEVWTRELNQGIELVRQKIAAGKLQGRTGQVQMLGRLLSTRHREIQIGDRDRLLLPEGFREFLGVEPAAEVMVIGAAICIEIWKPERWIHYLSGRMPKFRRLFEQLSG